MFTPPELANRMLDAVADAWAVATAVPTSGPTRRSTFLDPFTKSGVFLREITRRLVEGLAEEIPDLQERVDHILDEPGLRHRHTRAHEPLARRSVYCSKHATGEHSIAKSLRPTEGNIWFERTEHTWIGGPIAPTAAPARRRCDRGDGDWRRHAYAFIHTEDIKARVAELFGGDMQFDVIVGNPPYQLEHRRIRHTGAAHLPGVRRAGEGARSAAS